MKLIIIGAGPGGYTAAFEAARRGMETILISDSPLGGVCLHQGCIPTKTIKASCDALALARRLAEYGIKIAGKPEPDPAAILARKNRVVSLLTAGLENTCKTLGVAQLDGRARLGPNKTVIISQESGGKTIKADAIIIATGSLPLDLPGLEFDHKLVCDSADALDLASVPKKLIIVGGGVMGCEMACIYAALGSETLIVEGQGQILPMSGMDEDIRKLFARELRKQGIRAIAGRSLSRIEKLGDRVRAVIGASPFVTDQNIAQEEIEADKIIVTVGRIPNTRGLGLEEAGVNTDKRGWIEVDAKLETSVPGIYAIGDVLGPSHVMLAHVAAAEGLCAVSAISGKPRKLDYANVPSAIFTTPEIGVCGMNEAEAKAKGLATVAGSYLMRALGKAQAIGELPGMFKLLANAETGELLGGFVAGAHASDLIAEASLALQTKMKASAIADCIHAHPTLSEGWAEAALDLVRKL